jgi:hypothetical protein
VSADGQDLASLGENRRARMLAYVPQEHTPAFGFTVLDVVLMGRTAYVPLFSPPSAADEGRAREALALRRLDRGRERSNIQLSFARGASSSSPGPWPRARGSSSSTSRRQGSTRATRPRSCRWPGGWPSRKGRPS